VQRNFARSAGFALGLAERAQWIDRDFVPKKPSGQPPDVTVVQHEKDPGRAVAVTRPSVAGLSDAPDSPASKQIVTLLRDGVTLEGGHVVHPEHVIWDAAGLKAGDVERVLEQVRTALASNPAAAARLRVIIDRDLATDEAGLRRMLPLPDGIRPVP